MQRLVFCQKYKKNLPGMAQQPYPGVRGKYIFDHISLKAWQEWQEHQTRLINEKQLDLRDKVTRDMLNQEMDKFFSGEEVTTLSGYQPAN